MTQDIHLTQLANSGGWASKYSQKDLAQVLRQISNEFDENLIVSNSSFDDASVYKLNEDIALVTSVDFFPPIVDDPYDYGQISAANAFSDIYAMGATPISALNIVGFPNDLSEDILVEILRGGNDKAKEAGIVISGGHTIKDKEPKYGLSVTGIIKPGEEITNSNSKVKDDIILTKPIGTGIITAAHINKTVSESTLHSAIDSMKKLNKDASLIMKDIGVNGCTDITGFGLLGHLYNLCKSSNVTANIDFKSVPFFDGVFDLLKKNDFPGGSKSNFEFLNDFVKWDNIVDEKKKLLLCDAQTSGGLLITLPKSKSKDLINSLNNSGIKNAAIIGEVSKLRNDSRYISVKG